MVRTHVEGCPVAVGRVTTVLPADTELVLHARADLVWLLEMVTKLRAEVAALREERHVTNEALSAAAEALRADRDRIAELEALLLGTPQTCRMCGAGYTYGQPCSTCAFNWRMAAETDAVRSASRLSALLAPSVEDPHDSPLHHPYRVGRDLPETGGGS
ncbi:hypothetical protein ABZX40_13190 [Streptomyces sp. NPDC004610]|uniref:hypothetical protein n=1 Tax=unclassified Streptomyces TaxID=2593676 RepID=UPI0033B5E189